MKSEEPRGAKPSDWKRKRDIVEILEIVSMAMEHISNAGQAWRLMQDIVVMSTKKDIELGSMHTFYMGAAWMYKTVMAATDLEEEFAMKRMSEIKHGLVKMQADLQKLVSEREKAKSEQAQARNN